MERRRRNRRPACPMQERALRLKSPQKVPIHIKCLNRAVIASHGENGRVLM